MMTEAARVHGEEVFTEFDATALVNVINTSKGSDLVLHFLPLNAAKLTQSLGIERQALQSS
jgi:hypothetical protein